MVNMTPAESVAELTLSALGLANQFPARFGEETLTDLLVLSMLPHRRAKSFRLLPTSNGAESSCGADLFVAVRHRTRRWSRLVLQAKKLYSNNDYRMLNGGDKCISQLEDLEWFARQLFALPLYLLYNHSNSVQCSQHWHCSQRFTESQLGCTLVPSWHIWRMISRPPPRDFDLAHNVSQSRPWRCAFDCPLAETTLNQMAYLDPGGPLYGRRQYDWPFEPMEAAWPEWLLHPSKTQLTKEDVDKIRTDLFEINRSVAFDARREYKGSHDGGLYPERLLIVDSSDG